MNDKIKKLRARLQVLSSERSYYDADAKLISNYITPGRGVYNNFTRPQVNRRYTKHCINPAATDASDVLVAGVQAGLVSPARPWFQYYFSDSRIRAVKEFADWLHRAEQVSYEMLADSNFYSIVSSFFTEVINYGTCPIYVGEDAEPVRFGILTWGEYFIDVNSKGLIDTLFRVIYMKLGPLIEKYGGKIDKTLRAHYDTNGDTGQYFTIIEAIEPGKFQRDKKFVGTQFLYNAPAMHTNANTAKMFETPLRVRGYHEFPLPTGRWEIIGSDVYGMGIGSKALPSVMRLQEHEKSMLMMVHKDADPPMNVPAKMRGVENFMPGGRNYYTNPNEMAKEVLQRRYDYQGLAMNIERIENRIAKSYFNDIFLTGARDPNASPYKAAEVNARESEKALRLGPSIEMLGGSPFKPLLTRVLNIGIRKGLIPEPPAELVNSGAMYGINMIGVLAQAQKAMAAQPIMEYLQYVMAIAQVDPAVMDNANTDAMHDEFADIKGVPTTILNSKAKVQQIREARQKAEQERQAKEEAAAMAEVGGQANQSRADTAKTMSEASVNYNQLLGT